MPPSSAPSRTPSGRPRRPSSSANAAEQRSLDSGWRRSCTASGPPLHGSLGSTGQRPTPPHYSLDPVHGPGVGLGLWPQFLLPTCSRRACSVGPGFFPLRGVFAAFSRPLLDSCFSLCDLRLFIIKRIVSPELHFHIPLRRVSSTPRGPRHTTALARGAECWRALGLGRSRCAGQGRGGGAVREFVFDKRSDPPRPPPGACHSAARLRDGAAVRRAAQKTNHE